MKKPNGRRPKTNRRPSVRAAGKDRLTPERRSWNMSRIRGKDTAPEKIVRSLLHKMGFRFRLHVRVPIPSDSLSASDGERVRVRCRSVSVDILLPKHKTALFVHGCFWHRHKGCKNCTTPTNRREWWLAKLNGNAQRDKLNQQALKKLGWRVIVIWECEATPTKLRKFLQRRAIRLFGDSIVAKQR